MSRSRHHREEAAEAQQEDRETGPFFECDLVSCKRLVDGSW